MCCNMGRQHVTSTSFDSCLRHAMHRLAIATCRKRKKTPPSGGDISEDDEDGDLFTEEQRGQLDFAEEAGDRPPPLVDGQADRWVGMDFAVMTPMQRKVYLDNSLVVLAAWVVDVVDAAGGHEGGSRWQEVARRMGTHLQAIDKATGVPVHIIQERHQELVRLLSGLGIGEEFNNRAKLARTTISTLATDLLTTRFQQENAANPPLQWTRKVKAMKNRGSTSSSGSKRDFGELLSDLQPQLVPREVSCLVSEPRVFVVPASVQN